MKTPKLNLTRTKVALAIYRVSVEPVIDKMLQEAQTNSDVEAYEQARIVANTMVAAAYLYDTRDRNSLSMLYTLDARSVADIVQKLEAGGHA